MPAIEIDKRVNRLHHARAGRPPTADTARQGHHGDLAPAQGQIHRVRSTERQRASVAWISSESSTSRISSIDGQPVARRADPPALKVVGNCSCWTGSKPFSRRIPHSFRVPLPGEDVVGRSSNREKMIDGNAENAQELAVSGHRLAKWSTSGPSMVGSGPSCRGGDHSWNLKRVIGGRHHRLGARIELGEVPCALIRKS